MQTGSRENTYPWSKRFCGTLIVTMLVAVLSGCNGSGSGNSGKGDSDGTNTTPLSTSARIIFLHHSTGGVIWNGGVSNLLAQYNEDNDTSYQIDQIEYPDGTNYPWNNYPYDYWNIWVNHAGSSQFSGQDTLEILTGIYEVIVFKHCFPVSNIAADTGSADITSEDKRIENYKLQYNALKEKMHSFPNVRFIVWTGAANVAGATTQDEAARARTFFQWVKNTWDEENDNIYVWDFFELETEGGNYLRTEYAAGSSDSHPSNSFAATVAPYFVRRLVDVIEGRGDTGTITGK